MLLSILQQFARSTRDLVTGMPTDLLGSSACSRARHAGHPCQCPDFVDDFELTWADHEETLAMLDDEYVITCARMFIEHCWHLP